MFKKVINFVEKIFGKTVSKRPGNPYATGNAVGGSPAFFIGRADILRQVEDLLRHQQQNAVVLSGQRRIGKTSVLKELESTLPKKGAYQPIFFDLLGKARQPIETILDELADKISQVLDQPKCQLGDQAKQSFRDWLSALLNSTSLSETSLVLLFDEFDALDEKTATEPTREEFFDYLREELLPLNPQRLKFVFAIGRNISDLTQTARALFRVQINHRVSLLTEEDTYQLVRLSENNQSLYWSPEAIRRVWELTNGHPFLTQLLGSCVWEQMWSPDPKYPTKIPTVKTPVQVEEVIVRVFEKGESGLEWLWDGLPANCRVVSATLANLAEKKAISKAISEEELIKYLRDIPDNGISTVLEENAPQTLKNWDILEESSQGQYRFRVELFRQWIAKHKPPKTEISQLVANRLLDRSSVEHSEVDESIVVAPSSVKHTEEASDKPENWENFLEKMENFSPHYHYLLMVPPLKTVPSVPTQNFGMVDWTFVIDFDPKSEVDGLLSACKKIIEQRGNRYLHVVVKDNKPNMSPTRGIYWYFASGRTNDDDSIGNNLTGLPNSWSEWNKIYSNDVRQQIELLAKSLGYEPIRLLIMGNDNIFDHLDTVLGIIAGTIKGTLEVVIVGPKNSKWETVAKKHSATFIPISLSYLCDEIATLPPVSIFDQDNIVIPSKDGKLVVIEKEMYPWLLEELNIVPYDIPTTETTDEKTLWQDFLRGQGIQWANFKFNHDVQRELTNGLEREIRTDLQGRQTLQGKQTLRRNLYHVPGAGGTTVARRIVWNLHKEYPCLILHNTSDPVETIARLSHIVTLSYNSVLLLIDGGLVSDRQVDTLYDKIAASHLSVVMLQIRRTFERPSNEKLSKSYFLEDKLSKKETDLFFNSLTQAVPDKRTELEREIKSKDATPFTLGLCAFEENFSGIGNFIAFRLRQLSEEQKKIVIYLSMAYYYGQRSISGQWFCDLLNFPSTRFLDFQEMPKGLKDLLILDEMGKWQILHQLVAKHCLIYLLSPNSLEQRSSQKDLWKYSLSDRAKEFANFCRGGKSSVVSEEAMEVVSRVFVYRNNSELLGRETNLLGREKENISSERLFSPIIRDIPSQDGQLGVFRHLTEIFPENAHFWAHLGRFYSNVSKDTEKAIEAIDHAIELNNSDHVLYHIKGIAIRSDVYRMISEKKPLRDVVEKAELASQCFAESRKLNVDDEHGYISEVQMIIRVLNYAGSLYSGQPLVAIATKDAPSWLKQSLESAEYLLSQVRQNKRGKTTSILENDCRAGLDVLYGNHDNALNRLGNLLGRSDVSPLEKISIRRSIIWVHLSRAKGNWKGLKTDEIAKIVKLLEDNLREEPFNEKNLRLWIRAIRRSERPPVLDGVIEKVSYWKANSNTIDATYYLYVLYALQVFSGLTVARRNMEEVQKECATNSRYRRRGDFSFEWFGKGDGIKQLIHQDDLGEWDKDINCWKETSRLKRVEGVIVGNILPSQGTIELTGGIKAFFVPGQSGHAKGKSENQRVTCFIGFSYEGLRAWSVKDKE